jgi:hypothetical protein
MSAIVRSEPVHTTLSAPPVHDLGSILQLAKALASARGFLPENLKTEGEIAAVILTGMELGLGPMVTLRSLHMVKGKVVLDASIQLALMVSRAGCRIEWLADGSDGKRACLKLERPGQPPHESTYTIEMAQKAGLLNNGTWQKHPAAMLRARCVSAAGKAYCPDVLAGVYVPGELEELTPRRDDKPVLDAEFTTAATVPAPHTPPSPERLAAMYVAEFDGVRSEPAFQDAVDRAKCDRLRMTVSERVVVKEALDNARRRLDRLRADELEAAAAEEALRAQEAAEAGEVAADAQAGAA